MRAKKNGRDKRIFKESITKTFKEAAKKKNAGAAERRKINSGCVEVPPFCHRSESGKVLIFFLNFLVQWYTVLNYLMYGTEKRVARQTERHKQSKSQAEFSRQQTLGAAL